MNLSLSVLFRVNYLHFPSVVPTFTQITLNWLQVIMGKKGGAAFWGPNYRWYFKVLFMVLRRKGGSFKTILNP